MRLFHVALLIGLLSLPASVRADDPPANKSLPVARVTPVGQRPADARLGKLRDLYDKYHPWEAPTDKAAWEKEAQKLRERILVSQGLWPMPPRTPLNAVIHGKIDKGEYTVEKVFFQSHPGHYVTGNLYRPNPLKDKHAAVLCPHGHWANGRFYDATSDGKNDRAAAEQIKSGAETFDAGARFPLQARCVGLVRMGCTVFHYDMVGYADSKGIVHRDGLIDAKAELWLQNHMGLQTWNSIRALDFVTSLPEVDPNRIAVTGASGGGTQTFMLCAIDPRPAVAFPAVMVSTDMQGGCVCENADYLRIGVSNIALAALFAPKPMAMSGADDWTINIETKGLPELKQVYSLYGKPDLVAAKAFPQFKHNYNQVAREMMYNWLNEHLKLGQKSPVTEKDFDPIPPKDLSVWDDTHPVPSDVKSAEELKAYLAEVARKQLEDMKPTTPEKLAEHKKIVGAAARVMLDDGVPSADGVETDLNSTELEEGITLTKGYIGRKGSGEKIPFLAIVPKKPSGAVLLGVNPEQGIAGMMPNGKIVDGMRAILDAGHTIVGIDVYLTGEYNMDPAEPGLPKLPKGYAGIALGYNRPIISQRVRDILTGVAAAKKLPGAERVVLAGGRTSSPWLLLARSIAGDQVHDAIIQVSKFEFTNEMAADDPNFLPGALKYGGLFGLVAAGAPAPMLLFPSANLDEAGRSSLEGAYSSKSESLTIIDSISPKAALERLAK